MTGSASFLAAALNNQLQQWVLGVLFCAWAWKTERRGDALTVIHQIKSSLRGRVAAVASLFTPALFFTSQPTEPSAVQETQPSFSPSGRRR